MAQEGQTATSRSGRPMVFQNGQWVYTDGQANSAPQEGQTATSVSGQPIVYRNGQWVYAPTGQAPASRELSSQRTANIAMETVDGRPLTLQQRAAFSRVPGGYATNGEIGTAQRPIPLAEGDDGSRLTIGQFGITTEGEYVEGTRPRQVQLGGGGGGFFRPYDEQSFRERLANDPVARRFLERPDAGTAFQEQVANALPLGQGPRLQAALAAPFTGGIEAIRSGSLDPIADAYAVRRDQLMNRRDMLRNEFPLSGTAGEIVGGGIGGGAAAQMAARAAPNAAAQLGSFASRGLPQAAAAGAAVGAPMGAAQGLGEANPIQGATQGAIGGAIGGAAAPYVVRGGAAAVRAARRLATNPPVVGRFVPPSVQSGEAPQRAAAREVQRVFAREGVTPEQIAQVTEEMRAAGLPDPSPLDVAARLGVMGPVLRTQGYGRATPEGRTALANYANQVRASFGTNVANEARRASRLQGSRAATTERLNTLRRQEQADLMAPVNGVNPNQLRVPIDESVLARLQGDLPRTAVRNTQGVLQQSALNARLGLGARSAAEDLATLRASIEPANAGAPAFRPEESQAFADLMNVRAGAMVPPPQSRLRTPLVEMIRRLGGIRERQGTFNDGEVANLFGRTNAIPGLINNRTGLPIDDMAERLRELGYFGEQRASGLDMSSTAAQEADLQARGSDLVDLLSRWQRDPDLYRFGQDEVYQSEYMDWAERLAQADEAGVTGPAAQARANAAAQAREAMRPIQLADLEAAAQAGAPVDRTLSVNAVERLRANLSHAENAGDVADPVREALGNLRRDLVDPVRLAVPQYGEMLSTGEAYRRQLAAMEAGTGRVLGLNPDEVAQTLRPMAGPERMRFAQGVSESIADRFAPLAGGGVSNTPAIAANPQVGRTLDMIYGPQRAARMRQNLGDLARRYQIANRIDPQSGSTTADNLASEAEAMSGAASLAFGGPVTRTQAALNFVGRLRGMRTPQEQAAFIEMMTRSGQLTPELLQEIAQTPIEPRLRALLGIQAGVSANTGD